MSSRRDKKPRRGTNSYIVGGETQNYFLSFYGVHTPATIAEFY